MAKEKLIIEKRKNREYVYLVQNVYDPKRKHTYKKKKYCGIFNGTYDAEGNPEFHKVRQQYVSIEECRFRDVFDELTRNYRTISKDITWTESEFNLIKNKDLIYYYVDFISLSCKLEMFIPLESNNVYCRFFHMGHKEKLLSSEHNVFVLEGKDIGGFRKFFTGDKYNQVLISNTRFEKDEIPMVYEGNTVFAYSQNQDELKAIKLLASGYEIIKSLIIPSLKGDMKIKYKKDLNSLSKLCTKLLSVYFQIELPEESNRCKVIKDLMFTNPRFIKIDGKWILLEDRISLPLLKN